MGLCLTKDEVRELTGWKRKERQIRWFEDQNIDHWIGADGSPRVLYESIMPKRRELPRRRKPNFAALHGPEKKTPSRAA